MKRIVVLVLTLCAALCSSAPAAATVFVRDVACAAKDACIAVGADESGPWAQRWDGSAWSPQTVPGSSAVAAVACPARDACVAVGDTGLAFDGTAWRSAPLPVADGNLADIACSSPRACIAVGNVIRAGHNNAIAARWNGTRWRASRVRLPTRTTYSLLNSVSCASARTCKAVGNYQIRDTAKSRTLVAAWNGSRWKLERSPNPLSGANGSDLMGVSCSEPSACLAIGHAATRSNTGSQPLVERFDGHRWAIASRPAAQSGASEALSAVSCATATSCMAVGLAGPATAARAWNGKSWSAAPTPASTAQAYAELESVSCPAPDWCMAVGDAGSDPRNPSDQVFHALVFNGASWAITA